jgi:anaerobic selenocysteine-containing dehydrogenase
MDTPTTQALLRDDAGRPALNRRDFLKTSALLGGSTLLATALGGCVGQPVRLPSESGAGSAAYPNAEAATQLYSVCLNCNTGCGIKAKIENGVVAKIDGNPFSPWTMHPSVPYATSVFDTARVDAPLCPKGQAGVLTAYDPYRITRVAPTSGSRSPSIRRSPRSSRAGCSSSTSPARRRAR